MRNLVEMRSELGLLKAKAAAIWQTVSKIRPKAADGINTMDDLNARKASEPDGITSRSGSSAALFSIFHDEYKEKYYKVPKFRAVVTHVTIGAVAKSVLQEPKENVTTIRQIPVKAGDTSGDADQEATKKRARDKAYRAANREKILTNKKAYRAANREKLAAGRKHYRELNREKVATGEKAYYETNREKILIAKKLCRSESREKLAAEKKDKEAKQAQGKTYYEANREKLQAYGRAYYRAKREKQNLEKLGKLATPKPEPTTASAASVESENVAKTSMTPEEIADFVARLYK